MVEVTGEKKAFLLTRIDLLANHFIAADNISSIVLLSIFAHYINGVHSTHKLTNFLRCCCCYCYHHLPFTNMQQEWTEDISTAPLNKRPMSEIYLQGPPCSQLAPSLREILLLPPPPMAYLTLLHQHVHQLTLRMLLLQQ